MISLRSVAAFTCVTVLIGAAVAAPAYGSPRSRLLTRQAYALAYDLQFAACYDVLADALLADPRDPAPPRAIAAVTWIEVLFSQGVATFEAFTGEVSKRDIIRPPTSPALAARFFQRTAEAASLADQQLVRADDSDANYQVGATAALVALYRSTVEGRTFASFKQGRRAVAAMERAREREPGKHETALVLGMSQYVVSTMSWPVRALARLSGLSGDREAALALLREAALPSAETETDALILLMIVDNREGRHAAALERLAHLQDAHPRNRLLSLNRGVTALAAGQPQETERMLSGGIDRRDWDLSPVVLGEAALWFANRGMARARLHRRVDAESDLQRGLESDPRDWVRGRIHGQIGDLALEAGEPKRAREAFEVALDFSQRGGDEVAVRETKRKLNALRR